MTKVICEKCGAENNIVKEEKDPDKIFYCLQCKSFFFKIGASGEIIKLELNIA
ncbi:MAG: hypothetical protein CO142_00300 [Candidatus Moranbacteria bacterium CG_4_9_14_3_um_filter_44_28]|nr:MAG: hypothetical protein COW51_00935 [Candidatus Moranbacteria bacterium CG17_big_fil_post_rev_8_21_14_2_50_44_12]PJA86428.1 MAG: hypothetical protein CO142_00300 [Candidatus Moranbacteria bacterium CG_4_9_14_3_um_filter_44_28]